MGMTVGGGIRVRDRVDRLSRRCAHGRRRAGRRSGIRAAHCEMSNMRPGLPPRARAGPCARGGAGKVMNPTKRGKTHLAAGEALDDELGVLVHPHLGGGGEPLRDAVDEHSLCLSHCARDEGFCAGGEGRLGSAAGEGDGFGGPACL